MKTEAETRELLLQAWKDLAVEEVKRDYGMAATVALFQARAVVATLLKVLGESELVEPLRGTHDYP